MTPTPMAAIASQTSSELALVRLALALGAARAGGPLSAAESLLCEQAGGVERVPGSAATEVAAEILAGGDPLGQALCNLRPGSERRRQGTFYTPPGLIRPMASWIMDQSPTRVVDPGCGSGRFTAEILRRSRDVEIWAIDLDPIQTLITRATLNVLGACKARVLQADYLHMKLPPSEGRTAFISNPPYVRHHNLPAAAKAWGAAVAADLGHKFSGLAGLHAHFFLATAQLGRPGDIGCFVTSAEWLDVQYGAVIRSLLLNGLGGEAVYLVEPSTAAFEDAQTTAAITCFRFGSEPEMLRIGRVASAEALTELETHGSAVPRTKLVQAARWTQLSRQWSAMNDVLFRPLGELVEVHRGIVTGANDYYVMSRERAGALGILKWCVPVISDAKEILESGGVIRDDGKRKVLLRLPKDIDRREFPELDAYLRLGEAPAEDPRATANRYICSHRRPWWYLGAQEPAPIVVSYMARQPPAFALNPDGMALLNIGHGLYPRDAMDDDELRSLVTYLNSVRDTFRGQGRTYQGGLEKFEPREMEALPIALSCFGG